MQFSLIAALSRSGVIGDNGKLPWKSKADMERFARITAGKPVIMGRKTWDSLPKKPLPGRLNVVISSSKLELPVGCFHFFTFEDAIRQLHKTYPKDTDTACIIGGAQIYNEALQKSVVSKMFLTYIESDLIEGDTYFDPFKFAHPWKLKNTIEKPKAEGELYDITFVDFEKMKFTRKPRTTPQQSPKY